MKVRKLIEYLMSDNELDDEIIVEYWDKKYFIDTGLERADVERVWEKFVDEAQETVSAHIEFTQTGYELADDLLMLIRDKEENNAELGE